MKICNVCQRCYEDAVLVCPQEDGSLTAAHSGSCEVAGNYRLERLLERDATGETYEATQISSNESFIIRFFAANSLDKSPTERESVLGEMQAAEAINHPNVNRVVESGTLQNGEFYVVSEAIGGQNLRDYLRGVGSLSETAAIIIARQAAEGLEAAHRAGVVHRGVSLANIILLDDAGNLPSVKLRNFDFGGFRQRAVVADVSARPPIDVLRYLSPEQCAKQTVDEKTDIYSLAVVFYELLTGRSPFDKPTLDAIAHHQINERPLEEVHYEVKALIKHSLQLALQKKPAMRTPTALNFARHLRHIEQVAAQTLAFQIPKQSLTEDKSAFAKTAAFVQPFAPSAFDSPLDESQPQIGSLAVESPAVGEMTATFVAQPFEEKIEEVAEVETAPVFQTEPIYIQKKSFDTVQTASEPIRIKRKNAETISFVPAAIQIRKKQNVAVPVVEERIFSSVPNNRGAYPPQVTPIPASLDDAKRPSRQHAPNRQSLFVGIGLVALLAFAGLGAFVYNRQSPQQTSAAPQQQQPIVVTPAPALPAEEPDSPTDALIAANDSYVPEEDHENALASTEESSLPTPKSNNQVEPRPESSTKNTTVKPDTLLNEMNAFERLSPVSTETVEQSRPRVLSAEGITQAELNSSLNKWITATNARDVEQQMSHYAPKVDGYYLARDASQAAVRADKQRAFERATSVNIKTGKPEIIVSPDGRSAKMRFRKKYAIREGQRSRNGEVIQELQWIKSGSGWRIVSERDVKVVNR